MANLTAHSRYPRIRPMLTSKTAKTDKWHLFSSIADDIKAEAKRLADTQFNRKSSEPDN